MQKWPLGLVAPSLTILATFWASTVVGQPSAAGGGLEAGGNNADLPQSNGQIPNATIGPFTEGPPQGFTPWPAMPLSSEGPVSVPGASGEASPANSATTGDSGDRAMGGFGLDLHPRDSVRYSTTWFPTVGVQGQPAAFEMVTEDFSFTHPLWADGSNALSMSAGVRDRLIDSDAILPDTGQTVPADLWNVNLGLRYARQLDNGWSTGGGVSIGSASDHPFWSIHEMNMGMNAMLRVPQNEHDAWLFTLMYSPTSELNFPVPGVAYSYNPCPEFHANIGLPLMIMWRPTKEWQFQATYMLLRTVHLKAQYRFTDWLSAVAAYDWSNEAYSLVDRPDLNDRFFIYDQRVSMGLQVTAMRQWTASLSAGYAFDRYLYDGTSFSPGSADSVNLGAGPYGALNVGARF